MHQLPFPSPSLALLGNLGKWDRKFGLQQRMRILAKGLYPRPSIQPFRAFIPIGNRFIGTAHKNRIIGCVQPLRLGFHSGRLQAKILIGDVEFSGALLYPVLKLRLRFPQLVLDAPALRDPPFR